MNVIVLGAGVVGTATAWYLREAGHDVTVIERQPGPAQETSFANGCQISVSHAEPWATPAGLTGLPQLIGRHFITDQQRLDLEAAYSQRSATDPSVRLDFTILLYTVLITFGLKKPMTYEDAIALAAPRPMRVHTPELASSTAIPEPAFEDALGEPA